MVAVTTRGSIHTVGKVDQFMGYRYLNRLWLHIRFNEDEVAMARRVQLRCILKEGKSLRFHRFACLRLPS